MFDEYSKLYYFQKKYNSVMDNDSYYYFPNINLAFYNMNSKKTWRKNIKKLYYDNDKNTISIKMYSKIIIWNYIIYLK